MTSKDYIKAAKIIQNMRNQAYKAPNIIGRKEAIHTTFEVERTFIQFFSEDNPRFNKQRFLAACNGESE